MAQKFLTDIELTRGLKDSSGDLGNSGQVLSSTGSALNWINATSAASVVYQDGFTGNGSTTAFTLANSIDNENKTQVYLDGVYQHKDTYSLSGTTLTFSTAPPNSSDIEVISFSSVSSADDILYDDDFTSAGLMTTNGSGTYSITTNNSSNWNTAYTYSQVGHLPLAGGTLTGGLTGTTAGFSGSITASGNSNSFGNTTIAALSASTGTFSASVTAAGNSNSFGATTFTGAVTGTSFSAPSGFINGSNGGIRIHSSGTKFFNITAANAARDNIMDVGASDARFKDAYFGGAVNAAQLKPTNIVTNKVVKFDGTKLDDSIITDDGTKITIAGDVSLTQAATPTIELKDTTNNYYLLLRHNNTNAIFDTHASSYYEFKIGDSEKMRLTNTGLAIGTTSPFHNAKLQIKTATNVNLAFQTGTTETTGFKINAFNDAANANIPLELNGSVTLLKTGETERMRIDSSGHLLLGTTTVAYAGTLLHIGDTSDSQNGIQIQTSTTGYGYVLFGDGAGADAYRGQLSYNHTNDRMEFVTSGSTRMALDSSGRLGIGTTSPSNRLTVSGNIGTSGVVLFDDGNGINFGNSNAKIYGSSASGIQFNGGGSEKMRLNQSGNLGIGTTSPSGSGWDESSTVLHIFKNATNGGLLALESSNTKGIINAGNNYLAMFTTTSDPIRFGTDGSERMRIKSSGEVGISNTNPLFELCIGHTAAPNRNGLEFAIAGSDAGTNILQSFNRATSSYTPLQIASSTFQVATGSASAALHIDSSQNVGVGTTSPTNGKLQIHNTTNQISIETGTAGDGRLHIGHFSNGTFIGTYGDDGGAADLIRFGTHSGDERMRIHSNGRVSIGSTTASANTLTLSGTGTEMDIENTSSNGKKYRIASTSSGVLEFLDKTANVERLRIHSDGSIGIGATPTNKLHVNAGTTNIVAQFQSTDGTGGIMLKDSSGNVELTTSGTHGFNIQPNGGSTVFRVDQDGKVGIGTTSPEKNLSIGSSQADGIQFNYDTTNNYRNQILNYWNSNTDTRMDFNIARTSGQTPETIMSVGYGNNVGIGTTSPGNKLQVVGNITIGTGATNEAVRTMLTGGTLVLQATDGNHRIIIRGTQNTSGIVTGNSNNMDFYEFGGYNFYSGVNTGTGARTLALAISNTGNATFAGDVTLTGATALDFQVADFAQIKFRESGAIMIDSDNDQSSRNFTIKDGSGSTLLTVLDTGNVGIGTTSPYGKLTVNGALTVGPANQDSAVTLTETGDDVSLGNGGGSIEINMPIQGTTTNGCTLTFTYAAASWKSWILDYEFASTNGMVKGVVGGYNNGSTGHSKTKMLEGFPTSVAVAAVGSGNQHVQVTFTFSSGMGVHPFARFIYSQGGGDSTPRADRVTVAYVEGS